jgi:hypothetical protein
MDIEGELKVQAFSTLAMARSRKIRAACKSVL